MFTQKAFSSLAVASPGAAITATPEGSSKRRGRNVLQRFAVFVHGGKHDVSIGPQYLISLAQYRGHLETGVWGTLDRLMLIRC